MGIVNATPDSFFESSRALADAAVDAGVRMAEEGADMIDVGGESTRPGALPVAEEEECRRVLPVIERLAKRLQIPISVDTYKAAVARRAREAGATVLNDISALRGDERMLAVAKSFDRVILMHMQGTPRTMQEAPSYEDVVGEIRAFFEERLAEFAKAGGDASRALFDPGIGFGKTVEHNVEILRGLERFKSLGRPIVVGASRKSFIGRLLGGEKPLPPEERLEGSLAVACRAAQAGAAVLRVHDVLATRRALDVFARVSN